MPLLLSTETEPFNLSFFQKSNSTIKDTCHGDYLTDTKKSPRSYGTFDLNIDAQLIKAMLKVAHENEIEFTSFLITATNVVLQRYTGQQNVLLGQAFIKAEADRVYLAELWNELISANLLSEALQQVNDVVTARPDFIDLPQSLDLSDVDVSMDLFQIFFISDSAPRDNSSAIINALVSQLNDFYFGVHINEHEQGYQLSFFYDTNKFTDEFFNVLAIRLHTLLWEAVNRPDLELGEYNVLGKEEYSLLIDKFNDTVTPYPREKTIFDLFERRAAEMPAATALIKGEKQLSYDELNRQANQLARYLICEGITPGDNVGLLTGRGFEMIIAMLGILKAGGAYVPIDPDYPLDRQEYIYTQSAVKMVVADRDYPLKVIVGENNYKLIDQPGIEKYDSDNPALKISSDQLAYTIYTSGSTGKPKGVMIAHHSAVNLLLWVNNRFNITGNDRLLFITSMCFDLSVYDIFGMLSAGGAVVIAEKKEVQNVHILAEMLMVHKITFWDSVPTTLDFLVKTLENDNSRYRYNGLKTAFISGDWIPVSLPDRIKVFFPGVQVVSLGGATEGTVWSNYFIVDKTDPAWNSIPYGRPIANNFFYILNDHLQPVPLGTVGDLYIGGAGVAKGYANDIGKTARSFIPDPFHPGCGGMMYRTGDSGRMMPDFNMEFIGRQDNQVKIQGFRVELGEIESVLNGSGMLNSAIVLAKPDRDGNKRLVAYVINNAHGHNPEALKSYLHKFLPEYMIPSVWIALETLPLTGNGKIDRNALPEIDDLKKLKREYVAPATETERMLVNIWKENFRSKDIDVLSNFFDIGGHSLMAVQILSKLKKITGKNLQLSIFYKYPSVRLLGHFLDKENEDYNFKSLVAIKPSGSKNPLYIIHGDGLNVLNFSKLADHVSKDQPIYGLQALGLNGIDEPIDNLPVIAHHYMQEIIQHNPHGPYLLAGYSSGGYVAMEIRKQLVAQGREVKMLIIFDTDAEKTEYKDWYSLLPKKAKRHVPLILRSMRVSINQWFKGKALQLEVPVEKKKGSKEFYKLIQKIKNKHITAFRNYPLEPFDGKLYLYRAKISVHYVEYGKYLGWDKFAKEGVELFEIPGDHFSMLQAPHVAELGEVLQKNIDDVTSV
ncbi:amino acid adenylation domain-containing protein [Mucilaginibacter rubeus]|uniref:Amino acid adenylation domain-containing protein n=1 Tax=Mucilaginibacter rubeus TaxID=2027860 RepID=A0AAE6JBK1_9SPHI|nr:MULTISPECIES: amino acid adenylation domain-containing protein [Mucilaginibacter]QEM02518.1 amino acid adenylation domain-containing protein [Mucilaginibacter rubeus]QEM15138.1 amino acid adenylation domain-containing protein [Mucilaginibacter gossypii]QTE42139.1 amino acid adenylation domain-containing protein [Mucilaginibacter rubeus]QTE48740.1 amino acid adenylation domain-containing protein [Mucilaginibacter rubeus]QTE53838.1 amino acid adenylation domain-containing protein [Mucilaginib